TAGGTTSPTTGPRGATRSPTTCPASSSEPGGLAMRATHLIGMLLGTEEDWPSAFEQLMRRLDLRVEHGGDEHVFETERITIHPFDLRMKPRHAAVIDRLGYWYHLPREWLKKVALMDDVYLLNSPFTFQAMEKHSAYCAMMRLG